MSPFVVQKQGTRYRGVVIEVHRMAGSPYYHWTATLPGGVVFNGVERDDAAARERAIRVAEAMTGTGEDTP